MLRHPTLAALEPLKLTGMATALAEQLEMPDVQRLSFEERLGLLVDRERTTQENRRLARRLAALVGHLNLIHPNCIQVIGGHEAAYLASFDQGALEQLLANLFAARPSAVMLSSAIATRVGGGAPHSERQRAEHDCSPSFQLTNAGSCMTISCLRLPAISRAPCIASCPSRLVWLYGESRCVRAILPEMSSDQDLD